MKEPKLTIALTERNDQPILLISRNDNAPLNRLDWKLDDLASMGHLGACAHIGAMALKMLHAAHSPAFAAYPALQPEDSLPRPDDGFQYLLHMSFLDRTRAYLPAMDALMTHHAQDIAEIHREHWQDLRARITNNFPDGG